MYLKLGSGTEGTEKTSESQKLEGEFVPQLGASVCRDDGKDLGWTRLGLIAVDRNDHRIRQVV